MAPTLLDAAVQDAAASHTISLTGTAGRGVLVFFGLAAAITLDAGSASDGWVLDKYQVNNIGAAVARLDGADNPGTVPDLIVTHNGPRQMSYVALEDDLDGGPNFAVEASEATTSGVTSLTTGSQTLAESELMLVGFVACIDNAVPDITAYSGSFTEVGDSGAPGAPGAGTERSRTWVAYANDRALAAEAISATLDGTGGTGFYVRFVAGYTLDEAAPPDPVTGEGAGTNPVQTGSGTGSELIQGSGTGTQPVQTGAGTGVQAQDVTGSGTGSQPAQTGSGSGSGGVALAPARGGGWRDLQAILVEARQIQDEERNRPPVACPNDGEPLVEAPHGGLFCRFDGWKWGGT